MKDANTFLISDIDGTLVPRPIAMQLESTRYDAALPSTPEKLEVLLNTGRPYDECRDIIKSLSVTGLSIFDGGASVIDTKSGRLVACKYVDEFAISFLKGIRSDFSSEAKYTWNGRLIKGWPLDTEMHRVTTLIVSCTDTPEMRSIVTKIDEDTNATLQIKPIGPDHLIIIVRPVDTDKATHMSQLITTLPPKSDYISAGDSSDDLPFIEFSQNAVLVDYNESLNPVVRGELRTVNPFNSQLLSEAVFTAASSIHSIDRLAHASTHSTS